MAFGRQLAGDGAIGCRVALHGRGSTTQQFLIHDLYFPHEEVSIVESFTTVLRVLSVHYGVIVKLYVTFLLVFWPNNFIHVSVLFNHLSRTNQTNAQMLSYDFLACPFFIFLVRSKFLIYQYKTLR